MTTWKDHVARMELQNTKIAELGGVDERNAEIYCQVKSGRKRKDVAAEFGLTVPRVRVICDREELRALKRSSP
jgi:hypothetical protein